MEKKATQAILKKAFLKYFLFEAKVNVRINSVPAIHSNLFIPQAP